MSSAALTHAHPLAFFFFFLISLPFPPSSSFAHTSCRRVLQPPRLCQPSIQFIDTPKKVHVQGFSFNIFIFLDLYTVLARGKLRHSHPLCLAPPQALRCTDSLRCHSRYEIPRSCWLSWAARPYSVPANAVCPNALGGRALPPAQQKSSLTLRCCRLLLSSHRHVFLSRIPPAHVAARSRNR